MQANKNECKLFYFSASVTKNTVRNSKKLDRFIYIACSPKSALQNWIDFGRNLSKTLWGEPFILREAAGVDMFPHTEHIEMILLFERLPKPQPMSQPKPSTSNQSMPSTSHQSEPSTSHQSTPLPIASVSSQLSTSSSSG